MITWLCLDRCSLSAHMLVSHHFYWNTQSDQSEVLFQELCLNHNYMTVTFKNLPSDYSCDQWLVLKNIAESPFWQWPMASQWSPLWLWPMASWTKALKRTSHEVSLQETGETCKYVAIYTIFAAAAGLRCKNILGLKYPLKPGLWWRFKPGLEWLVQLDYFLEILHSWQDDIYATETF